MGDYLFLHGVLHLHRSLETFQQEALVDVLLPNQHLYIVRQEIVGLASNNSLATANLHTAEYTRFCSDVPFRWGSQFCETVIPLRSQTMVGLRRLHLSKRVRHLYR